MGLFGDVFGLAVATSVDIYNEEKKRISQEQERLEKEAANREEQRNFLLGEDKKIFLDLNLTDAELDEYEEIILDAIEKPLPISEIKSFTKGDNEFRLALYLVCKSR
jgi:hypothetical protein